MITPLGIKSALAKAKKGRADVFASDNTGRRDGWRLVLRCMCSGSASWLFRYTHAGKRYQIRLGAYPSMDINSARSAAIDYAKIYKDTHDVLGKLRADELAMQDAIESEQAAIADADAIRQKRDKFTLAGLMQMYVDYLNKQEKITTAKDVQSLSQHLTPIAHKPAAEITKRDLVTIQRTLLDAGKGRTANKLRSFVRAAYALVLRAESDATAPATALGFATVGNVDSNPAALLAVAKGYSGTSDRILTDTEMFILLDRAGAESGAIGLAVRGAVLLGGQRMIQLLRATITDVQDGFIVLLDPKGRRDDPRRHPIPLDGMASAVIDEAASRARTLGCEWLFSSYGTKPLHRDTVAGFIAAVSADLVRTGVSTTSFSLADLRRTVETRLAGMGVSKDTRAQLLSHGLSGVQTRNYDRHEYEQEKRGALRLLHRWIETRREHSAEVMPIHRVGK